MEIPRLLVGVVEHQNVFFAKSKLWQVAQWIFAISKIYGHGPHLDLVSIGQSHVQGLHVIAVPVPQVLPKAMAFMWKVMVIGLLCLLQSK